MASAPITEAEIHAILAQNMQIDGVVEWWPKSDQAFIEAKLQVKHPQTNVRLMLIMTGNLMARKKFSLSLLLNSAHRIVGLDVRGSHKNSHTDTCEWFFSTHQHKWTDICHGGWAYTPGSVPDEWEQAFRQFCQELGIRFRGKWTDPPEGFQSGLGDL